MSRKIGKTAIRKHDRSLIRAVLRDAPDVLQLSGGECTIEAGADGAPKTFSMHAYTGGPMHVKGFNYPIVVDLRGMAAPTKSRPVLRDHDTSKVIGHTTAVVIEASDIFVDGVASGSNAAATEVIEAAGSGFSWQASIGARINAKEFVKEGKSVSVNGRKFQGPVLVAKKTTLREISFVALGADDDTHVAVAASSKEQTMTFQQWLEESATSVSNDAELVAAEAEYSKDHELRKGDRIAVVLSRGGHDVGPAMATALYQDGQPEYLAGAFGVSQEDLEAAALRDGFTTKKKEAPVAKPEIDLLAEAAKQREQIAAINTICAGYDNPTIEVDGKQVDLAAHAMKEKWDSAKVELEAMKADGRRTPAIHSRGRDDVAKADVIEAALCLEAGVPSKQLEETFSDQTMEAATSNRGRKMRSLHAVFHEVIRAAGDYYPAGVVDDDFIRCAYKASQKLEATGDYLEASTSGTTTLSLTTILGAVAYKTALASYQSVETTWREFCSVASHANFHTVTKARLTGVAQFLKVGQDGELKHSTVGEETFTNQVATYGRMLGLTRQDQINDDLQALTSIASMLGRGAALMLEELFYKQLLAGTLYSASTPNANQITDVLAIAGLTEAVEKFGLFVDPDFKPTLVSPVKLLVPPALKVTADDLFQETRVNETTTANKRSPNRNPHAGMYRPVVSPYLQNTDIKDDTGAAFSNQSATQWYLFADPMVMPSYEMAFLRGQQTPVIDSGELSFNRLGMEWRGYLDAGIANQNLRGSVKSTGA